MSWSHIWDAVEPFDSIVRSIVYSIRGGELGRVETSRKLIDASSIYMNVLSLSIAAEHCNVLNLSFYFDARLGSRNPNQATVSCYSNDIIHDCVPEFRIGSILISSRLGSSAPANIAQMGQALTLRNLCSRHTSLCLAVLRQRYLVAAMGCYSGQVAAATPLATECAAVLKQHQQKDCAKGGGDL